MKTYRQLLEDIELVSGISRRSKSDDDIDEDEFRHGSGRTQNLGKIHKDYSLHKKWGDFYITHDKKNKVVGRIMNSGRGKNVDVHLLSIHPQHTKRKIGHSLAVAAYKHLHKTGHTVRSGTEQSVGGASVWQHLMKDPSTKRHVHAIRKRTDLGQASKLHTGDIWTSGSGETRRAGSRKGIRMHKYSSPAAERAEDVSLVLKPRGRK